MQQSRKVDDLDQHRAEMTVNLANLLFPFAGTVFFWESTAQVVEGDLPMTYIDSFRQPGQRPRELASQRIGKSLNHTDHTPDDEINGVILHAGPLLASLNRHGPLHWRVGDS